MRDVNMRLAQTKMLTAAVLAALMLVGCAGSNDQMASLLVTPGKYKLFNCAQLAAAYKGTTAQAQELKGQMAKAQTGAGGQAVDAAVYQPEYLMARGELNELRREARAKHCTLPLDAAGAAAVPQPLPPPPKLPPS
jgi:hypothetical protein